MTTTIFSPDKSGARGRPCHRVVVKGLVLLCAFVLYLGISGRNVMAEDGHYVDTIEDIQASTAKSAGQEAAVNPVVFEGTVSYDLRLASNTVRMTASRIHNTSSYNTTGRLRLEFWLLASPYQGGGATGYQLAKYQFPGTGQLQPGHSYTNVDVTVPLLVTQPPAGTYYPHLFIMEYSSTCGVNAGYCSDGWVTFNPIQIGGGGSVPNCTLAAAPVNLPWTGGSVFLSATCSGSPTQYTWTDSMGLLPSSGGVSVLLQMPQNNASSPLKNTVTVRAKNASGWSIGATVIVTVAAHGTGGGFTVKPGISGTWVDAAARGEAGLVFEVLANNQFVITWYSYAANGGMAYFGGVGAYQGDTVYADLFLKEGTGARFPPFYSPVNTYTTRWGSVQIKFSDCNHAVLSWWPVFPGYSGGSVNLMRLTSIAGLSCY